MMATATTSRTLSSVPSDSTSFTAPTCSVEVDRMNAAEWSAQLDRFDDANLYQTWPFGEACWGSRNCSRLALKSDGEVVALAQVRIVRPGPFKFGLAQVRWGPVCRPRGREFDPTIARRMAVALREEYAVRRGLCLRVLPQAFQGTPHCQALEAAFADFRSEPFIAGESYRTILLDLTPPLEVLRKQLDQKWRNQLNRAEKNNLTVVEGRSEDDFRAFLPIFQEMHRRKRLKSSADIRDYEAVQRALPLGQRMLVLRCELAGEPVAGLVGAAIGDTGVYLLGATSDAGMQAKGSYLLQWRMIQRLKELGLRAYNLGGINPVTNPGVYHFKKGFSGDDVLYLEALTACDKVMSKVFARASVLARGRWSRLVTRLLKHG
jgi:Acetyltransferase (GNAT) domain